MFGDFDEDLLAQWCELYVRFVTDDTHRLVAAINNCGHERLQAFLSPVQIDIATFLAKTKITGDDRLTVYGYLHFLDSQFWRKPHWHLLNGFIEQSLNGSRYVLVRRTEHPIARAIPEKMRFKPDNELGDKGVLQLRHHWQRVEFSIQLEMRRSDVFNVFTSDQTFVKIGLSPFADSDDMLWHHDATDKRGGDARIPFWCCDAKNEAEQLVRLKEVLSAAREQQVHILLFPELVMTNNLETALSDWLRQHNAFDPIIRLVIAGTRHVFDTKENNTYSNRCTVFNSFGDIEWEQEKCQPFLLTAEETNKFFSIQAPAFEPTQLSQRLVMRHTDLGVIATPICLDFFFDELWKVMPVDVFFVPAMSPNLTRFQDKCRAVGNSRRSAAFVCNAQTNDKQQSVFAYRPARDALQPKQQTLFLFTVEVDIDMNYD